MAAKPSLDNSSPSLLASSLLPLVILVSVITTSSLWTLVVVPLLPDSTMSGNSWPLSCIPLCNLIYKDRSKATSTKPILPSADATTIPPRSPPEAPATRNSPKKSQSTSHHAMNLVWFLTTALIQLEKHIKTSPATERQAHEWAILIPVSIRALFVEKVSLHENSKQKTGSSRNL